MKHSLGISSPQEWLAAVLDNFDEFLIDHAANEKKASAVAMSLISHYPDKTLLVEEMIDLALEELNHYRQVMKLMLKRNLVPLADEKDPYVNKLIKKIRRGSEQYFLDRLLTASLIEARGAERFDMVAGALEEPTLAEFYRILSVNEAHHHTLFLNLANTYFPSDLVTDRWHEWVDIEAEIIAKLPIRSRVH